MGVSDLLRVAQEVHLDAKLALRVLDGVPAQLRVGLHDLELFGREAARLQENAVRNADLADVMERRRLVEHLDGVLRQERREARMGSQAIQRGPLVFWRVAVSLSRR
jgi:hypothetical protein